MTIPTSTLQQIDELLSSRFKPDAPGASVIVCQDNTPVFRKGYGLANLEHAIPVQPHMVFRLGSITKQFTAVAILKLYEDGKLDLQDDLTKFLPGYPTHDHAVTLEHLLTHTSGIHSYTEMPEWMKILRNDLTPAEMVAVFKDQPFDFAPGEKWSYNNSGYFLLGVIIEKVSGMSYAEFIQRTIFTPLGMQNSYYDDPVRLEPGRASGYSKIEPGKEYGYKNTAYMSMTQPYAAGSLASSVDDLAIWEAGLTSNRLLKPETLHRAFQPYHTRDGKNTRYGYGWGISEYGGHTLIGHGGGINGFITQAYRVPDLGLFVALLTNCDDYGDVDKFAFQVMALAMGQPYQEPVAISLPAETLHEYAAVYQIDDKNERIIKVKEGKLYSQRTGGSLFELFALGDDRFFFKDSSDILHFHRDDHGKIGSVEAIRRFGVEEIAPRTEKPLPPERQPVELARQVIEPYLGEYEMAPGITMKIYYDGDRLMSLFSGQEAVEIYPESETVFFVKDLDAQLEFQRVAGQVTGLVLHQGDQHLPLKRLVS